MAINCTAKLISYAIFKENEANQDKCKPIFTIICTIIVLLMVGYWFYKYAFVDRDIGVVDYVSLKKSRDIEFPAASLCFQNPFIEDKISRMNSNFSSFNYLKYLNGELADEMLMTVDYQNVTIKLKEYFLFAEEYGWNNEEYKKSNLTFSFKEIFNGFWTKRFLKCFSLDPNWKTQRNIKSVAIYFDLKKLMYDWRNSIPKFASLDVCKHMIAYTFHYPGQFFLGDVSNFKINYFSEWSRSLELAVEELEILERRNSRNRECSENSLSYDDMIMEKYLSLNGCKPSYFNGPKVLPACNMSNDIEKSQLVYKKKVESY